MSTLKIGSMAGLPSCTPHITGEVTRPLGGLIFMIPCVCRKYEVVEMLGKCGADVNVRDLSGSTAYDIASVRGKYKG